MPRCRFLFAADLGDPVSCIFVNETGCMGGTMLGKVWSCSFDSKKVELLAGFSDEGVRGLYMDQEASYLTLSDGCKGFRRSSPQMQVGSVCFRSLDRKNTQSVKHVLQRGPWACVLFPISSSVVHVTKQEHQHRAFKLFDFGSSTEVAPCDFDGETMVIIDRSRSGTGPPVLRLVQLERNEQTEIDDLPKASSMSLIRLWGADCLAYAVGSWLYLYDYRKRAVRRILRGHRAEIVAIDAQDSQQIATLSTDAVVKLWNGNTGVCTQTLYVHEASFFLGFPYHLCVHEQHILVSADEGVFLLETDTTAADKA